MTPNTLFGAAFALWLALLVPTIPLSMHDCHGFVGALAHSPLYAFIGVTAALPFVGMVAASRRR